MPQSGTGLGSGDSAPQAPSNATAAATPIVILIVVRAIMIFPPT
jgi:hypothetical protein